MWPVTTQAPTPARPSTSPSTRRPPDGSASLVLLNLGVMAGWFGPIQVLLAQQADRMAAPSRAA